MQQADHHPQLDASQWRLDADAPPFPNALILARLARLAYLDAFDCPTEGPAEAYADAPSFCAAFPVVRPIHTARIRGFVAATPEHTVVAFAGTHRPDHWSESLRYDQVIDFGGRAHRGFAEVLDEVMTPLFAGLYDSAALSKPLWLTGHSLGGAVSVLAGWRLHHHGFEPHTVCTFGAPPVLDEIAAKDYPVPVWRFANDGDWVPSMQWPRLGNRYAHPGQTFYLLRSGRLARKHHSSDLARKLDRFDDFENPKEYGGPFVDHTMKEYIRRVRKNLDPQAE